MRQTILNTGLAGQVMTGLRRRRNAAIGLRMTAMIDVIFLLLTFFVLTARFRQPESHLNVSLPKPSVGTAGVVSQKPLSIHLEEDNSQCVAILPSAQKITLRPDTIETNLSDLYNSLVEIVPIYDIAGQGVEIYCSDDVQWNYVVKVYDVLYRIGAVKVTFVTEEKILSGTNFPDPNEL